VVVLIDPSLSTGCSADHAANIRRIAAMGKQAEPQPHDVAPLKLPGKTISGVSGRHPLRRSEARGALQTTDVSSDDKSPWSSVFTRNTVHQSEPSVNMSSPGTHEACHLIA
jgi:hypothetical protein